MRILFINTVYGVGSTGKITRNFLKYAFDNGHSVAVVSDSAVTDKGIVFLKVKNILSRKATILFERFTGLTGCFSPFTTRKVIGFIKSFSPDVIYLGNLHGFYINIHGLYKSIKFLNIPCVQIMFDEFSMTGNCAFSFDCEKFKNKCCHCKRIHDYPQSYFFDTSGFIQKLKRDAYLYDRLAFVSVPYTISRARESYLLNDKMLLELDEAVDQNKIFFPKKSDDLKSKLGIKPNYKVVLNVCVYPNERKGGRFFLELASKCGDIKDLIFVHVGFNGSLDECPSNYIPVRFINDQMELATYYNMADLFVCTSLAETQPNTCLEALSCGTPICGFNVSGVPTCAEKPFGEYVDVGDIEGLKRIVTQTSKKTEESVCLIRAYAENRFSMVNYNKKLIEIGSRMIAS